MRHRLFLLAAISLLSISTLTAQPPVKAATIPQANMFVHPWQGTRVGFLGDSITDPNAKGKPVKLFWQYLHEWLSITPYVHAVNGRQWNDIPRQAEELKSQHGDNVDAIIVFIGTNDFNSGVPLGQWYTEVEETVQMARGSANGAVKTRKRLPLMSAETLRGRINMGICRLKQLFPTQQIVLMTPIRRGDAKFGENNIQPNDSYPNGIGLYLDAYVDVIKEAANVWAVPVIDMNALSGINPTVKEHEGYFYGHGYDILHPSSYGHECIASTLYYQLLTLPAVKNQSREFITDK